MITRETPAVRTLRCAVYTRKSTEKNLDLEFNSLDAQREACEAYIASQRQEGWVCLRESYDDGGFTGGNMDRPAMKKLVADIERGKIDAVIVYKIDRISRSLLDFAKLMELFERHNVAFTAITQQFSTTTALGRLTLNILLSFAEFERSIGAERVRDKVAAAKRKGKYLGGPPAFGYDVDYATKKLVVNPEEAKTVRWIFKRYIETGSCLQVARELAERGITVKSWLTKKGKFHQGGKWSSHGVYNAVNNRLYLGDVVHQGQAYPGEHDAIVPKKLWDQAQAVSSVNENRKQRPPTTENKALLRGIIRCGHCGRSMTPSHTKRRDRTYRYYVCVGSQKFGYDSCPIKCVPAGDIEEAVLGQLRSILTSPDMAAQTARSAREIEAESGVTAGGITESEVSEALRDLDGVWNELFPAEQHRIFRELVEQVNVTQGGIDVSLRADGIYSVVSELRQREGEAESNERYTD